MKRGRAGYYEQAAVEDDATRAVAEEDVKVVDSLTAGALDAEVGKDCFRETEQLKDLID